MRLLQEKWEKFKSWVGSEDVPESKEEEIVAESPKMTPQVIWEGNDDAGDIRACIVDPGYIVFERGSKSATGEVSWSKLAKPKGVEDFLVYELAKSLGTLPEWATKEFKEEDDSYGGAIKGRELFT